MRFQNTVMWIPSKGRVKASARGQEACRCLSSDPDGDCSLGNLPAVWSLAVPFDQYPGTGKHPRGSRFGLQQHRAGGSFVVDVYDRFLLSPAAYAHDYNYRRHHRDFHYFC
jgi:hypothetical protein